MIETDSYLIPHESGIRGLRKRFLDRSREVSRIQTGGERSVAAIVAVAEEARRVTGATATVDTLETVTP